MLRAGMPPKKRRTLMKRIRVKTKTVKKVKMVRKMPKRVRKILMKRRMVMISSSTSEL